MIGMWIRCLGDIKIEKNWKNVQNNKSIMSIVWKKKTQNLI